MTDEPRDIFATFVGELNQTTVRPLVKNLCLTAQDPSKVHLHLALQSTGGTVAEGVYLHHFIKAFTIPITIYNIGNVSSAAVLVYLAAPERVAAEHASFMIHRVSTSFAGDRQALDSVRESLAIDNARLDKLLRHHISMSNALWRKYDQAPLWISAKDSITHGISTKIGWFKPPLGAPIYDLSIG